MILKMFGFNIVMLLMYNLFMPCVNVLYICKHEVDSAWLKWVPKAFLYGGGLWVFISYKYIYFLLQISLHP